MDDLYLEYFVSAYIECALWTSTDDNDYPLEENFGIDDISARSLLQIEEDCKDFVTANAILLKGIGPEQAGHDFWLTRNRHGVGFWDRGLREIGDKLSEAAKIYGGVDLYVGDDGKIYS